MSSSEEYGESLERQWNDSHDPPTSSSALLVSPLSHTRWNQLRPRGVPRKSAQPCVWSFLYAGPSIGRMPMVHAVSRHWPASSQITPSRPSETSESGASADLTQMVEPLPSSRRSSVSFFRRMI